MTVLELLRNPVLVDADPVVKELLADFARDLIQKANDEWSAVSYALHEDTAEYHRAKAHALCEVLGDQDALFFYT